MSSDPGAQNGAAPPETARDSDSNADVCPAASPEQLYEEAMARLTAIADQWHKARDALLGGQAASTILNRPRVPPSGQRPSPIGAAAPEAHGGTAGSGRPSA